MRKQESESTANFVEKPNPRKNHPNVFDGVLISISDSNLVMKGKNGQELSVNLNEKTKSSIDGVACERGNLRLGQKVRVFTEKRDLTSAIKIAALDKQARFAPLA